MVKIPMDKDKLDGLLEEQERRTKERQKRRRLSHIDESQLVEPIKQELESSGFCPDDGITTWYAEPDVFVRERKRDEVPANVTERPDLICEWEAEPGAGSTLYVIELKKRFGKKGIGQILTYYWAVRNGAKIVDGDREYSITGDEPVIMIIGTMEYKSTYYDEVVNWLRESIKLEGVAGIEVIPIEPE